MNPNNPQDRIDQATSSRLAKLGSCPVDPTALQQTLEQALNAATQATNQDASAQPPSAQSSPSNLRLLCQRWWRPLASCAAAILVAITLGWLVLGNNTSRALAAPAELAQIHYDVAHGLSPHMSVSSIEQANAILKEQSDDHVPLPPMPGELQSCCLHHHVGTLMTCAMIKDQGQLITVAIADASKLRSPKGQVITRNSQSFVIHKANGINMVMSEQNNRWLCVMGEAPFEQLIEVASKIHVP